MITALIVDHSLAMVMADLGGALLDAVAPVAAVIVAGVLALAGVAKATDRATTTTEFAALGLPWPGLLARIVPPLELGVAGLVLLRPRLGGAAAAILLLAFTLVLVRALRAGRSVSCGCLGPLSRQPVSATTLVRNGLLTALALLTIAAPTPSAAWQPVLPAGDVVLAVGPAVLLAVLGAQVLALRSQIGRVWSVELAGEAGGRRTRHPNQPTGGSTDQGAAA